MDESIIPGGSAEVQREGFALVYITPGNPFSWPSLQIGVCMHLKYSRGPQYVAVEEPVKMLVLTELWDAAHHLVNSAAGGVCSWGRFAEPGCVSHIFVKPFAQPAANTPTRMISYYVTRS